MFKVALTALLALVLTGCGVTAEQQLEVKEVEIRTVRIPDVLLQPCVPESPPAKETFMGQKPHEREQTLTAYIISLLSTVRTCNIQLDSIKKLQPTK